MGGGYAKTYPRKWVIMSVKQKYLKDENGEVFSPIVSASSVYDSNGNPIEPIVLFNASSLSNAIQFSTTNTIRDITSLSQYIGRNLRITISYYNDETPQIVEFHINKANMSMFPKYIRDFSGDGDIWIALMRVSVTNSSWVFRLNSIKLLSTTNTIVEHRTDTNLNNRFYVSKIEVI